MDELEKLLLEVSALFEVSKKETRRYESYMNLAKNAKANGITRSLMQTHEQVMREGDTPLAVSLDMFTDQPSLNGLEYATENFFKRAASALERGGKAFWKGLRKIYDFIVELFKRTDQEARTTAKVAEKEISVEERDAIINRLQEFAEKSPLHALASTDEQYVPGIINIEDGAITCLAQCDQILAEFAECASLLDSSFVRRVTMGHTHADSTEYVDVKDCFNRLVTRMDMLLRKPDEYNAEVALSTFINTSLMKEASRNKIHNNLSRLETINEVKSAITSVVVSGSITKRYIPSDYSWDLTKANMKSLQDNRDSMGNFVGNTSDLNRAAGITRIEKSIDELLNKKTDFNDNAVIANELLGMVKKARSAVMSRWLYYMAVVADTRRLRAIYDDYGVIVKFGSPEANTVAK